MVQDWSSDPEGARFKSETFTQSLKLVFVRIAAKKSLGVKVFPTGSQH